MRAPFNTTVTLYDGPGTGTPGFPRIVAAPCRMVPDPRFKTLEPPENAVLWYLTLDAGVPFGPTTTDLGGGIWQFDYTRADRADITLFAGAIWVILRVELCTPPNPDPTYFRCHLIPDPTGWTPCQASYASAYKVTGAAGQLITTLYRVDATHWSDGKGWILTAETAAIFPGCNSTWSLTSGSCTWAAIYNGAGAVTPVSSGPPCPIVTITSM